MPATQVFTLRNIPTIVPELPGEWLVAPLKLATEDLPNHTAAACLQLDALPNFTQKSYDSSRIRTCATPACHQRTFL